MSEEVKTPGSAETLVAYSNAERTRLQTLRPLKDGSPHAVLPKHMDFTAPDREQRKQAIMLELGEAQKDGDVHRLVEAEAYVVEANRLCRDYRIATADHRSLIFSGIRTMYRRYRDLIPQEKQQSDS